MRAPYFIETLARNGEVLHRQRIEQLPVRIGRGYDNDCILDDDHVSARHALIEADADGQPLLRDLGSRNGIIWRGRRHASVLLDGDTEVRLGHTHLRLRGVDHAVPPELPDTAMYGWEGAKPALLGLALIGASAALSNWLGSSQSFEPIRALLALAYGLAGGLVWSALWAFGNRLFGRHARLGRHLFILGCGLCAMEAWKVLSSMVAYAWSMESLTRYGNHMLIALASLMIVFHLRTIAPRHPRRLAATGLILTLLGSGLVLIGNMQLYGRLADELYMAVLLPPALRRSPDHGLDEFFAQAGRLRASADAERAKTVAGSGFDDDEEEQEPE